MSDHETVQRLDLSSVLRRQAVDSLKKRRADAGSRDALFGHSNVVEAASESSRVLVREMLKGLDSVITDPHGSP
jgi:hypothetical protein